DAIDDFNAALERNPDYQDAYLERALAYSGVADYSRALSDLEAADKLKAHDVRVLRVRGAVKEKLRDDPGAVEDYSAAIQIDPKDVRLYLARSAVYMRLNKLQEALKDRDEAVT